MLKLAVLVAVSTITVVALEVLKSRARKRDRTWWLGIPEEDWIGLAGAGAIAIICAVLILSA